MNLFSSLFFVPKAIREKVFLAKSLIFLLTLLLSHLFIMAKNKIILLAEDAFKKDKINASTLENLTRWIQAGFLPAWATQALEELVSAGEWEEINTRFFQELTFGTGGMRGLTIGRVTPTAETETPGAQGTPAHAAIGTNTLNDFTLAKAVAGLYRHTVAWLARQTPGDATAGGRQNPALVVAHDVRHFSSHFCELAAAVWTHLGGDAYIFKGARSTPQLSFTVRHLKADAGIVITASHNPPEYNGFKCYFNDGAQVVPPHDVDIVRAVSETNLEELAPLVAKKNLSKVKFVPTQAETAYFECLSSNVLNDSLLKKSPPVVVYTNLHGTGSVMIPRVFEKHGVHPILVKEQSDHDPRFPTVQSPNPENPAAFKLAIETAGKNCADIAIATDPDDDRVGAAVRERDGSYRVLTGNQIGSALAAYRITCMKELGILPKTGSRRAALIKTFVTTPFQDAIAAAEGIRTVNVPTGFKWIGAKLGKYQRQVEAALANTTSCEKGSYDSISWRERAELQLQNATFFVFGGEESMGYLGMDATRDKDGNASALMLVELAAWLKNKNKTFSEFFDEVTQKVGTVFTEDLLNIQYEAGAASQARIRAILSSLRTTPPRKVDGSAVIDFKDYGKQDLYDEDGDPVPKEDFYFFTLADGRQFAVRGSGTEPKIKYYLFARTKVHASEKLDKTRRNLTSSLESLKNWLKADARKRSGES